MAHDDPVGRATFELYTADPASFMSRRAELVREARSAGAKDEAKAIGGIRKPQRSAFILNRYAAAEPDRIAELLQLGTDLRQAERELDGPALRELSTTRRRLVADLVRAAVEYSEAAAASSAVHEELTATLNAAIADGQVAAALRESSLTQPAEWSGFGSGFSAGGPALLSLVPDTPNSPPVKTETAGEPASPKSLPVAKADPSVANAHRPAPTAAASRPDRQSRAAQARNDRANREAQLRGDAQVARERAEATRRKRDEAGAEAAASLAEADRAVQEANDSLRIQQEAVDQLADDLERARKQLRASASALQHAQHDQRAARIAADRIRRHLHGE